MIDRTNALLLVVVGLLIVGSIVPLQSISQNLGVIPYVDDGDSVTFHMISSADTIDRHGDAVFFFKGRNRFASTRDECDALGGVYSSRRGCETIALYEDTPNVCPSSDCIMDFDGVTFTFPGDMLSVAPNPNYPDRMILRWSYAQNGNEIFNAYGTEARPVVTCQLTMAASVNDCPAVVDDGDPSEVPADLGNDNILDEITNFIKSIWLWFTGLFT